MSTERDGAKLYHIIREVYESHSDRPSVSPAWLATEAMETIQFPRGLHEVGYEGCHLQFRQIARSFCRRHFDPTETVENDLFPETLQQRYPLSPNETDEEPTYVLLDRLGQSDLLYNVTRLRKEARAKLSHADALEAWGRRKFQAAA